MIYTNNKQVGLSVNEVNNLVTKLIENKQDKKIIFEGQEMLLTTALQRVNNSAVGKANIIDAETLPDSLIPNSQYWVKTYNGQTIDNGRYIILVDNLGTPHFMGQSTSVPVVDIQVNGSSIIDGATQIANIQPKATIDGTVTDNDIPSAKAVRDLFNNYVSGENLFDGTGFSILNDRGEDILGGLTGAVYKIFDNLYAVSIMMIIYDTLPTGSQLQYNANFTLKDGTNLLDKTIGSNRPLPMYTRIGELVGSCMLGKDKIHFNVTRSTDIYMFNGLLFRF